MNAGLKKLAFSFETKLISLAGVVYIAVQGFNEPTLTAAVHDGKLQLAVFMSVLAWFSKSNSAHGTPDAPIPPEQAAKIAAVADRAVIHSFVGAQLGTSNLYEALPNDPTPAGEVADDPRGKFMKHVEGTTQYYVKQ